jgi:hypothetical protein
MIGMSTKKEYTDEVRLSVVESQHCFIGVRYTQHIRME